MGLLWGGLWFFNEFFMGEFIIFMGVYGVMGNYSHVILFFFLGMCR